MAMANHVMRHFYLSASGDPTRLPWHRDQPSDVLVDTVQGLPPGTRVLDVGCGAGVFAVWMASRRMQVTAIDLFPEAIDMAAVLASEAGVDLSLVCGDLFDFRPDPPFAMVFDSGCLHSLVGGDPRRYKTHLLRWLAPRGAFVLEHWGRRHRLDWRLWVRDGDHPKSSPRSSDPNSSCNDSPWPTSRPRCHSGRQSVASHTGSACGRKHASKHSKGIVATAPQYISTCA